LSDHQGRAETSIVVYREDFIDALCCDCSGLAYDGQTKRFAMKDIFRKRRYLRALTWMVMVGSVAGTTLPQNPPTPDGPATGDWKTYEFGADGFKVRFPSEPLRQEQDVPIASGSLRLHTYIADDGTTELYIGVCDYGEPPKTAMRERFWTARKMVRSTRFTRIFCIPRRSFWVKFRA